MHKDILKLKLNDELDLLSQIWGKEIEERVYESRQGKLEIFSKWLLLCWLQITIGGNEGQRILKGVIKETLKIGGLFNKPILFPRSPFSDLLEWGENVLSLRCYSSRI